MREVAVLRRKATILFAAAALAGTIGAVFFPGGRPFFAGVGLVAVLQIPGYWALSLTLRRSSSDFFGAMVGGMVVRMAGLGIGVGLLWRGDHRSILPFVVASVAGLIGFSFIELFFIGRQNRLPN